MARRCTALAIALLIAGAVAGPVEGARPAPTITSVTITADGGTWPYCEQVARVAYRAGHQKWWINVMPMLDGAETENHMTIVRGTGTADIAIAGHDYSATGDWAPNDPWRWMASIWSRVAGSAPSVTSAYDFRGSCPAAGVVLASWTAP